MIKRNCGTGIIFIFRFPAISFPSDSSRFARPASVSLSSYDSAALQMEGTKGGKNSDTSCRECGWWARAGGSARLQREVNRRSGRQHDRWSTRGPLCQRDVVTERRVGQPSPAATLPRPARLRPLEDIWHENDSRGKSNELPTTSVTQTPVATPSATPTPTPPIKQ